MSHKQKYHYVLKNSSRRLLNLNNKLKDDISIPNIKKKHVRFNRIVKTILIFN